MVSFMSAKEMGWLRLQEYQKLQSVSYLQTGIIKQNQRIGDGSHVHIWGDNWLPDRLNPRIISYPYPLMEHVTVADLIDPNLYGWDEDVIRSMFNQRDANLIMRIPLPRHHAHDKLIWGTEDDGMFSVKSCYRVLQGVLDDNDIQGLSKIWSCKIPPKVKTFIWLNWINTMLTSLPKSTFCNFLTICWNIWSLRNNILWNGQAMDLAVFTVRKAKDFYNNWFNATKDNLPTSQSHNASGARWTTTLPGYLKLNVDATIDNQSSRMGFGCALRDDQGQFVAARGTHWRADSLQVVQAINSMKGDSSFHLVLNDVKNLLSSFTQVSLCFVRRSANQAAHLLAKQSVSLSDAQSGS
ncbi:PREDICTED: uncharacterized protein LOC109167507 [Ipomoea nil]|uniref:uncharacterized protein LOC109167507 n=1 Tax=Ipomoea nil TaxID=35883 RepID=UPI000900E525|nr:PREDICTED: uncharacterized protein LOC109167507 [Ipomoea nil]